MRISILPAMVVVAMFAVPAAFAHELDGAQTVVQKPSAEQIAKSAGIPQTTVVRVSKKDPSQVEVVFLKEKLAAGQKVANLNFEKMAVDGEKTGIAYTAKDELDATSSTSTWSFGYYNGRYVDGAWARGPYRSAGYISGPNRSAGYYNGYYGGAGYYRGPNVSAGYIRGGGFYGNGYYRGYASTSIYPPGYYPYGNSRCYGPCGSGGYYPAYYPTYRYASYSYDCEPYYTYSDDNYDYAYTSWAY